MNFATAQFLVLTPFASGHVLATVEGADLFSHKVLEVRDYMAVYSVKIDRPQTPS